MFTGDDPTTQPGNSGWGVAGGAAGLIGGLYDSYQNRKTSRENTDKTIAHQKAEAELAYQRSVEMWNMQNMYNSPAAQMERFKAGGLNPHLIYGQGSSGNASGTPQYHPPDTQYRYAAPSYGAPIAGVLPQLMAVGTWMQNMRLSQAELENKSTNIEKSQQLIDYLMQAHPHMLKQLQDKDTISHYQKDIARFGAAKASQVLTDLQMDFRQKYGDDLFGYLPRSKGSAPFSSEFDTVPIGGTKRLDFLKSEAEMRLKRAQASWTDFDITNPQALMQMVLSGVMGMAGQQLRLSTHRRPKVTHEVEEKMRSGRTRTRRRSYGG